MKRSKVIMLTLAGVGLGVTGCRRAPAPEPVPVHSTAVLPPGALSPELRATLPAFAAGEDVSRQAPPHNAYDPHLGYYHQPCSAWFPFPYDYYDSRWGYYRCGRWSRYHSTRVYPSSSSYYRVGPHSSFTTSHPSTPEPAMDDYTKQPSGAPIHTGVPQTQATMTRSAFTSRGGFGRTGFFSGMFSGS
jgi:hypothetical protein